jgi:hypothetical protein
LGLLRRTKIAASQHMGSTGRFAHPRGVACKIVRNIDLSLLKTLKVGETPGFLWLSEFEGTGAMVSFRVSHYCDHEL